MKKLILKQLSLDGYRGQNVVVNFNDDVTKVYGRNAAGKSTLMNAFLQLLTRFDARDKANAEMLDTTKEVTFENNPSVSISAVIMLDEFEYTLKQTAQANYKRNRETGEHERDSGFSYKFEIDGIERTATNYVKWIEDNIAPVEKLKIMANIYHFNQNIEKWEVRRKHLAEISGDITKEDFKGEFSDLFTQLERYSVKELKEKVKTMTKPLKERLGSQNKKGSLLVEIESMESNLPDITEAKIAEDNISEIKAYISNLDTELADRSKNIEPLIKKREAEQEAIASLKREARSKADAFSEGQYSKKEQLRKELEEVRLMMEKARVAHAANGSKKLVELKILLTKREGHNADGEKMNAQRAKDIVGIENNIKELEANKTLQNAKVENLRKERVALKEKQFVAGVCSECGSELKGEKLDSALADFNKLKNAQMENIVVRGKAAVAELKAIEDEIAEANQILEEKKTQPLYSLADPEPIKKLIEEEMALAEPFDKGQEYLGFTDTIDKLTRDIATPVAEYHTTKECSDYVSKIKRLEASLTPIPEVNIDDIKAKKEEALDKMESLSKILGLKDEYDKQIAKIKELKATQREVSSELAKWEKMEFDIKAYEKEYARIVQARTNALFNRVTVDMLKENKSGELEETCRILYRGVPAEMWNNAEKSLSGIDISLTFMKFYGVMLPIFVDNTESINQDALYNVDTQMIQLYVSETDYKVIVKD